MSRSSAFELIWPPAADDFDAEPEVCQARRLFRIQMAKLIQLADQAIRLPVGAETTYLARDIAALLQNISGTASYFGFAGFGRFASTIEQPVRAAFTAELLLPLCTRLQMELAGTRA